MKYLDPLVCLLYKIHDLPAYRRIDKTAVREHLEAQLRDHIAEEA